MHAVIVLLTFISPFTLFARYEWLENIPLERFSCLAEVPPQSIEGYNERIIPYFVARGVDDEETIQNYVSEDLVHIAHALSLLFEQNSTEVLQNFLGSQYSLIADFNLHIDHVGRELYGPLSFYLPFLSQVSKELGLNHIKNIVFPSTQVVKVLQVHDPELKGVTIGRIYFQNIASNEVRCIELFQPSPPNDEKPQNIVATLNRFFLLTAPKSHSQETPIDHLALELNSTTDVQEIHERINRLASATLMPYQNQISYNAGDKSTNTKVLLRDNTDTVFNKIIEFVHYGK